jgi:hypothetical protein
MKSTNTPEVYVMIWFHDGERLERRFHHCEDAWMWERKTRHLHANRRKRDDRREPLLSLYAGSTTTGKAYGGILWGRDQYDTELASRMRYEQERQAKLHPAEV